MDNNTGYTLAWTSVTQAARYCLKVFADGGQADSFETTDTAYVADFPVADGSKWIAYRVRSELDSVFSLPLGENSSAFSESVRIVFREPICSVSATSLEFATIAVGNSADATFTIENIGGGILDLRHVYLCCAQ